MKHDNHGFTIVELLIVIVVIGILAAITIVAFNGIQNRAAETAVKNDLAQIAKKLEAFKVLSANGIYPVSAAELEAADIKVATQHYQTHNADGTQRNNIYYGVTGNTPSASNNGKTYAIGVALKNGVSFCLSNGVVTAECGNGDGNTRVIIGGDTNSRWIASGHSATAGWQAWVQ